MRRHPLHDPLLHRESGVRQLERTIATICLQTVLAILKDHKSIGEKKLIRDGWAMKGGLW
ncbi:MAG: hypothetical protein ACLVJ6_03975 [Merdibacter sp.]